MHEKITIIFLMPSIVPSVLAPNIVEDMSLAMLGYGIFDARRGRRSTISLRTLFDSSSTATSSRRTKNRRVIVASIALSRVVGTAMTPTRPRSNSAGYFDKSRRCANLNRIVDIN